MNEARHRRIHLTSLMAIIFIGLVAWGGSAQALTWTGWNEVPGGGFISSGPAVVSDGANLYLLVRGTDDITYLNTKTGGSWSGWTSLGGKTLSGPALVLDGSTVRAFVRGTDDHLYWNSKNGTVWTGWSEVPGGGVTSSGPAAVSDGTNLYLLARGTDDVIYLNTKTGDNWSGWTSLGGKTLSGPALVLDGSTVSAFVRGTNDHLYWNSKNGTVWTGWSEVPGGGTTLDTPAAAYTGGELHLFVQGPGNRILLIIWTGAQWSNLALLDGATPNGPGAARDGASIRLAVRGTDNRVYLNSFVEPLADTSFKNPLAQKNSMAVGDEFTCTIKNSVIECLGKNTFGQLGNGQTNSKPVTKPVKVALAADAKPISISAGIANACTILSDQSLMCWGANTYGQLGNGTTTGSAMPVAVKGLGLVARVALGGSSTCAVTPASLASCWGAGANGQLGNGANPVTSPYPTTVAGLSGVLEVGVGLEFACALRENGQVSCWGNNTYGQLGKGDKTPSNVPVAVKDGVWSKYLNDVTALTVGETHACVLLADKTGRCWGKNDKGQLGTNTNDSMTVATPIFGGSAMEEIIAHGETTCTRVTNGQVYCWGNNSAGQFGNGVTGYATAPVLAFNGQKVSALGIGGQHICAVLIDGVISCQGSDDFGQLNLDPTKITPPLPATDALAKMIEIHHQLVAAIPVANKASGDFSKVVFSALEPTVKELIDGKTPTDLLPNAAAAQLRMAAVAAEVKSLELFQQLSDIFAGLFPPEGVSQAYAGNINDTYAQAASIYMSALISQTYDWPEQKTNCAVDTIENEKLLNYLTSFGKDIPKASGLALGIVKDMQCLSPGVAAHLGDSIFSAYTLVTRIVGQWRPAYAQAVRDALLAKLAPLLFPLEEITRSQFPDDPAILLLNQYVARLNKIPANQNVNEYGILLEVPFLYLRDPAKPLWEGIDAIPFCSSSVEQSLYYKTGNADFITKPIQEILPIAVDGDGEKTVFGALVTDVDNHTCGAATKTWPAWSTFSSDPNNTSIWQGCMVFRTYANMVVNTILLGDGTCKDWNTFRIGKPCCAPPKTSRMEKRINQKRSGFAAAWDLLSNLLISTAHAQERSTTEPTSDTVSDADTINTEITTPLPAPDTALTPMPTTTETAVPWVQEILPLPVDPYVPATATADTAPVDLAALICPPAQCYEDGTDLIYKMPDSSETRYPQMTRNKWIELMSQRIVEQQALETARASGTESLRNHLLQTAALVVRGTPTAQTAESPDAESRRTLTTVTVSEVLRGTHEQPTLTVVIPGGCTPEGDCETVLGLRPPQLGQEAIFLLYPLDNEQWGLIEFSESIYRVENERLPELDLDLSVVRTRVAVPAIVPAPITAPAAAPLPAPEPEPTPPPPEEVR